MRGRHGGEVQYAVENLTVNSLLDLRRRTRVGWAILPVRNCSLPRGRAIAAF